MNEYLEAEQDFIKWLSKEGGEERVRRAKKAVQLVKIGYLKRLAARLKIRQVVEWVDNFLEETGEERKIILFGIHKKAIELLTRKYEKVSVTVSGSTPGQKRQLAVDQFQHNRLTRIFIGQMQAAGVGINLTAATDVAFFEMGWTPGEHLQAEDRAHRIGQDFAVFIHYLIAKGTIEATLCSLIRRKQSIIEATLDGHEFPKEFDIFDELTRSIQRRKRK